MAVTTIETVLYDRLIAHAGLAALVAARVYPNVLPQGVVYPAVSFRRVASDRDHAMGTDAGIVAARFQFDCWGATYLSARTVANQLILALQRWRTTTGVTVQDGFIETEIDLYEAESQVHHIVVDVMIFYRE